MKRVDKLLLAQAARHAILGVAVINLIACSATNVPEVREINEDKIKATLCTASFVPVNDKEWCGEHCPFLFSAAEVTMTEDGEHDQG